MRSAIAFGVAALAGSAFAAPQLYGNINVVEDVHVVVETVVHTIYIGDSPTTSCTSTSTPVPEKTPEAAYAPPVVTVVYPPPPPPPAPTSSTPTPTPTPIYTPPPAPPAPTSTSTPPPPPAATSAVPAPSNGGYMDIVNEWRAKLGLSEFKVDIKLENNALKTIVDANGAMKHELNEGTFAQVMAPGKCTIEGFGGCWLGGWLCERPNAPALQSACSQASKGWEYMGQTDHHDILVSTNYGSIGCKCTMDMWACDLA